MKCSTIIVLVKQNINKKVFQQKYRIHKLPDKIPENARKLKVYHISFILQKHCMSTISYIGHKSNELKLVLIFQIQSCRITI